MNTIYEVQKFGVTIEWEGDLRRAQATFKSASSGEVVMYKIVGSVKYVIDKK